MLHPDGYLDRLYDTLQQSREALGRDETWEKKRARLIERLKQLLGEFPLPENGGGLDPVVTERVELDEVIREHVEFTTLDGLRMPAYVVIPKHIRPGERLPAALLWHGHGYGGKRMVGLLPDGTPAPVTGKPGDNLALELARRGLVVIAPDEAGIGSRMLARDVALNDPDLKNSCYNLSVSLLMTGRTTAGLRAYEALRTADYMITRPEVDSQRLGNIGYSGGGTVASLSAALDDRIRASVVGLYPNTYRGSILHVRHCLCNYIPGLLQAGEMPDFLGLIAPRPLFIETGMQDKIYPVETAREAIRELNALYKQLGCEHLLDSHIHEGGHEVSGAQALDWLADTLKEL
ncbi:Alpha/beta hydrolase family protein [Paenibacillus konkukensis]|uniref:Alpha/beta hydrolase family protein n=1 Tax=Paenibacillus konkukensis TaxID=2020716 RepID=A0ABY4S197_9BACL|nr:alpha/beta hydrolase family protein [Paenibacillus konkukensis]UQZ87544.1 Alpha/beta hydrolase family protein [Paenibacillus konkukensis]